MSLRQPALARIVRDFTSGFLDAPESDTLPPGATPDARNAFLVSALEQRDSARNATPITPRGGRAVIRKRKGARLINPTAMAAGHPVVGLVWFEPEATPAQLLAVCNGNLYKYDGTETFTQVGAGFTPDAMTGGLQFKDNVWWTDGTVQKRWNGTQLYDVGFDRPTGAPTLSVAAGPGVTGTYEGFAVWWDSVMDHESSPSPVSAAVVFANQQRTWTKPAGTPPAQVSHWRIYARRVDTNEVNYYRTATVPIGTTSVTEALIDAARRIPGPRPNENDKPPVFAIGTVYKDFLIAIKQNESYYYVSKQGDPESVNPNDKFAIERGSGKPLRSAQVYRSDVLLQKPTKTFRLAGDKPPFLAEPVHTDFGNVGSASGIEVEKLFYAWDEHQGPYRTDLVTWEPLATNRIKPFLNQLNLDELRYIQVEHDTANSLVVWAIPCTDAHDVRRRHLLAYNYRLNTWLPPISGLEFYRLTAYQPVGKTLGLYCGDYWGRVFELFAQDHEGLPQNAAIIGTVTSATANTVTCAAASFYTGGDGMMGLLVLLQSPARTFQWRRIASNTATTITLDTAHGPPWLNIPGPGWTVHLGAIEFYWTSTWITLDHPGLFKRGGFMFVEGKSTSISGVLSVLARFNQNPPIFYKYDFTFPMETAVWGRAIWGQATWGSRYRMLKKRRINRAFYSIQLRFESYAANAPLDITSYGVEADPLPGKRAAA